MADNQKKRFALAGLKKYFDNKTGLLSRTNVDENIGNFFKQGVANVQRSLREDPGQYNVFTRPISRVISDTGRIGQALNLKPQTSEDIGYFLR